MTQYRQGLRTKRGLIVRVNETYVAGLEAAAAYRQAMAEFQSASTELQQQTNTLKRFINDVARAPSSVCFADIAEARATARDPDGCGPQWQACDYPTPRDLQAALDRRYSARERLILLWSQMPAAIRQRLTAPPRS